MSKRPREDGDPHTTRAHNLYRWILANKVVPLWKAFEMCVSINTNTFALDMAPPCFFDDESFIDHRDCGIDHINIDKTVVGQSKHYESATVDWNDLARFHLASDCLNTSPQERFIATLPDTRFTHRTTRAMHLHNYVVKRTSFEAHTIAYPTTSIPSFEERPSQLQVLSTIRNGGKVVTIQAPPGWGKTFVSLSVVDGLHKTAVNYTVVILVPTCDLLQQTADVFERHCIPVTCIDGRKNDALCASGVIVCTYQSIHRLVDTQRAFDIIIADEAHHLDGEKKWNDAVQTLASPSHTRLVKLSGLYAPSVAVDHVVSYQTAIDEKVISDYCIMLQHWTTGRREHAIATFVKDTPSLGPLILVFWNSLHAANESHVESIRLGMTSAIICGNTPDGERQRTRGLAESGQLRVLHLCRCYNEGISIPIVSTVVFGDPRASVKNVFQCQARGNRLHDMKPFYRVVLPIFGNDEEDLAAVGEYVGVFARSDPRVHDAITRLERGTPTARVRITTVDDATDATYTHIVNYMGSVVRSDVDRKVAVLTSLTEAPKRGAMSQVTRGDTTATFDGGKFLHCISNNWHPTRIAHTSLTTEQMTMLESTEWFATRLREWRVKWESAAFLPTVGEKVAVLTSLTEAPKRGAMSQVTRGDTTATFDGGKFLHCISNNWHPTRIAHTSLTTEQMTMLESTEWFATRLGEWRERWQGV